MNKLIQLTYRFPLKQLLNKNLFIKQLHKIKRQKVKHTMLLRLVKCG